MQVRSYFLQVALFLFCVFLHAFSNSILAHEIRPAIVDIDIKQQKEVNTFKVSIKLNLEALISQVDAENDSDDSENAQRYDFLREMPPENIALEFLAFEDYFLKNMQLNFDKKAYPLTVSSVDIPAIGDLDLARDSYIYLDGKLPEGAKTLSWRWDESFGNAAFRVNTMANPALYSNYLLKGQASESIHFAPDNFTLGDKASKNTINSKGSWSSQWSTFKNYVEVGFVHIVPKGFDHILFVVGLFLLSASLRPLLIQVTAFTLAHSVTLALGIYGVVNLPSSIVEPLIAASIIYVAIENIYLKKLSPWRPVIVFFFGLLHGLGFASVLTEIGLTSNYYITGLIAFNVGVELGQLFVVAICFFLFAYWFKDKPWYRQRITIPASIMIALIASYWLVERVGWV